MNTFPDAVAIIGMAGRFPGADTIPQMWQNLLDGVESIRRLSDQDLQEAAVPPELSARAAYVPANSELADGDAFDAEFFAVPGHEARLMDPQQRVFLECAWSSLEDAGYTPAGLDLRVGVFGSTSVSSYLINVLSQSEEVTPGDVNYPLLLGNDKDFLASRVSYKLGLTGPSMTVQTACSGSLTAVHLACQSLISRECSMAIAGGVSITVPQGHGYLYREGGILSADGHCRVFDAEASGTVKGSGCGVVVLRMLDEALAAGDHIYAVIRGTAINNDGSDKVGFTAPSPVGQEEVIREALQIAEVPASEIGYVEAHGTGTAMGDPIELRALVAAHRGDGGPPERCVIGSIKANLGHLDAAAGVVGLIKTALVLRDQVIPGQPTLRTVNPRLGLAGSPYVVATGTEKPRTPLRAAGVSSFGLGGTNAHAVLVPAASDARSAPPRGTYRVPVSAADAAMLRESVGRLRDWLVGRPEVRVDDVALTLAHGRKALPARVTFEASDVAGLLRSLEEYLAQPSTTPGEAREGAADDVAEGLGDLSQARRLPLPGTPLRRTRHWAVARAAADVPAAMPGAGASETLSGTALSGDAVASRICEIVGAQLGVEVAPDDDIFDLGVESMTLVEIVTQLRDDLAVPISFEEAATTRTARLLADVLAPRTRGAAQTPTDQQSQQPPAAVPVDGRLADVPAMRHALAPLRIGQSGRNVFLVHPAGGTTICYTDMGRQLSIQDSMYGIGFPMELTGRQQSIRDLARLYMGLIRGVQPSGPYTVGGYSFGGNVAFEMALLLEAAGEDVERVIMFDSHPPEAYVGGHIGEADYLEAFPVLMRSLFADLEIPQGRHIGSVAEALELVRQPSWSPSVMRELEAFFDVWRNNHEALRRYYPDTRLRADVLMLEAGEPENSQDLKRLGMTCVPKDVWRTHLDGDFRVVPVTGNHFSMFRDPQQLKVLATRFEDSLVAAA